MTVHFVAIDELVWLLKDNKWQNPIKQQCAALFKAVRIAWHRQF